MKIFERCSIVLLATILGGCSSMKPTSETRYTEAWNRVLNSQAWRDALIVEAAMETDENEDFYATSEDVVLADENRRKRVNLEPTFETKYDVLVRRAYVRIIAQAEKADDRLEREYILRNAMALKNPEKKGKEFNQKLEKVNKRYQAHREMLEGLKAWNIFSKYGTDDLKFFKDENQDVVKKMVEQEKGDLAVINYLIYKLADLYHFEG